MMPLRGILMLAPCALLLAGCAGTPVESESAASETGQSTSVESEAPAAEGRTVETQPAAEAPMPGRYERARIVADMLYAAVEAREDDRLMFPASDNAFDRYLDVLELEPDNPVARNGMQQLVERYQTLAEQARARGQSGPAADYTRRAAVIEDWQSQLDGEPAWSAFVEGAEEPEPEPSPISRERRIADTLYAAKAAFDDNRLMAPPGDNAYDRYRQVLRIDPDNRIAREGIEEIVDRYITLAGDAMDIAQYDTATSHLASAAAIEPDNPEIADARERLAQERAREREIFELETEALDRQSEELQARLAEIAQYVIAEEKVFLIVARTDAEGRWIYQVMREAVDGRRLRGNISLGSDPGIEVRPPPS